MKKLLILTALLASTAAAPAADISRPSLPASTFQLAGAYVGVTPGYAWGSADTFSTKGALGSLYAGWGYQFGSLYAGIETDFGWSNIKGSQDTTGKIGTVPFAERIENKIDWLGTTRARIGYAMGSVMLYGTGGAAYGRVASTTTTCMGCSSLNSSFTDSVSQSDTRLGWSAGAGIEYAVTQNLAVRTEWIHYDLSKTKGDLARIGFAWRF